MNLHAATAVLSTATANTAIEAALPAGFTPSTTAVAGNVWLTALVGVIPLLLFFVLLGVFKVKTHWCSLASLAVAIILAVVAFGMPLPLTLLSATQGVALGLVPIISIIVAAVWLYSLTEKSGA